MNIRPLIIAALCLSLTACSTDEETPQQSASQVTEQTTSATLPPPDNNGTMMNDLEYEISSISSVDTIAMLLTESIGTPFAAESVTQADMISISQGLMLQTAERL